MLSEIRLRHFSMYHHENGNKRPQLRRYLPKLPESSISMGEEGPGNSFGGAYRVLKSMLKSML